MIKTDANGTTTIYDRLGRRALVLLDGDELCVSAGQDGDAVKWARVASGEPEQHEFIRACLVALALIERRRREGGGE